MAFHFNNKTYPDDLFNVYINLKEVHGKNHGLIYTLLEKHLEQHNANLGVTPLDLTHEDFKPDPEHRKPKGSKYEVPLDDYVKKSDNKKLKDKKLNLAIDNVGFDDGVSSSMDKEEFANMDWKGLKNNIRKKSKSLFDVKE